MGAERNNPVSAASHRARLKLLHLLELLHLEADGTLDTAGQAALAQLETDPSGLPVTQWRQQLARTVTLLQGLPRPERPGSVAALVVSEIQGGRWLGAPAPVMPAPAMPVPAMPVSVARVVATDVSLDCYLRAPPLPEGVSVAAAVARDVSVQVALSRVPPIPGSVAALVAAEVSSSVPLIRTPIEWPTKPLGPSGASRRETGSGRGVGRSVVFRSVDETNGIRMTTLARPPARAGHPVPPAPAPAARMAARMAGEAASERTPAVKTEPGLGPSGASGLPPLAPAFPAGPAFLTGAGPFNPPDRPLRHHPAPLFLVASMMVALTLMGVTSVWPNLAAGAEVARALLAQVSPVALAGLGLLLVTSVLVSLRPGPLTQRVGAGAFALSAALTLPTLYGTLSHGNVTFGKDLQVSGPVRGNVINVGGSVHLRPDAQVQGEVVALLGDVHRDAGAQVSGRVNALLGHAPDDHAPHDDAPHDWAALQTGVPQRLAAVTAAAFRPVLGWLGSAAWPQVFVTLTGGVLLLLFVSGLAPMLARRQRSAPVRTLALGVLALSALLGPACGLTLAGLLGPALIALALTALLIALGLSVSAYDVGRALALRVRLPVPDAVGAFIGLSAVAATLSVPPLAFALALVGGTWGAGTLLLTRGRPERLDLTQAA
ncbi:polymer-forming cytoskeletal protein [Deinococcus sp.]|uniref:polymer-forming cytoskeletal protein n=1 Tax=Deinococcus sp. TaxID=47478 RepID=UPI0025B8F973|nr:polymer-forming cytoskeletal protein [Deinococcus sp.]